MIKLLPKFFCEFERCSLQLNQFPFHLIYILSMFSWYTNSTIFVVTKCVNSIFVLPIHNFSHEFTFLALKKMNTFLYFTPLDIMPLARDYHNYIYCKSFRNCYCIWLGYISSFLTSSWSLCRFIVLTIRFTTYNCFGDVKVNWYPFATKSLLIV